MHYRNQHTHGTKVQFGAEISALARVENKKKGREWCSEPERHSVLHSVADSLAGGGD